MKNYVLYIAMFLIILCLPIRGNKNEVRWLWADLQAVPLTLLLISLFCMGFYLYNRERNKKTLYNQKK